MLLFVAALKRLAGFVPALYHRSTSCDNFGVLNLLLRKHICTWLLACYLLLRTNCRKMGKTD